MVLRITRFQWRIRCIDLLVRVAFVVSLFLAPGNLESAETSTQSKWQQYPPGPWGHLERIRIILNFPDKLIPQSFPETKRPASWVFRERTREALETVLLSVGLSAKQRELLLDSMRVLPNGSVIQPADSFVFGMTSKVRGDLYAKLANVPQNGDQREPYAFTADELEERIAESGISPDTARRLRALTYQVDNRVLFADQALLLRSVDDTHEQRRIVKMLFRYSTYLLRIRLRSGTAAKAAEYWDTSKDGAVRELLQSVASLPEQAATVDVSLLLPPLAKSRLFTYPTKNPHRRYGPDCYWTAGNFFYKEPDDAFFSPNLLAAFLKDHCAAVSDRPQLGDIAVLIRRDTGEWIHVAVYIAADMFFSKNGNDYRVPWLFSSLEDLKVLYGRHAGVDLRYFRPSTTSIPPEERP